MSVHNYTMHVTIREKGDKIGGLIYFDPEKLNAYYMQVEMKNNGDLGLAAGVTGTAIKIKTSFGDVDGETFEEFLNALLSRARGTNSLDYEEFVVTQTPDMNITRIFITSKLAELHKVLFRQNSVTVTYSLTDNQLAGLGHFLTIMGDYYWSRRVPESL